MQSRLHRQGKGDTEGLKDTASHLIRRIAIISRQWGKSSRSHPPLKPKSTKMMYCPPANDDSWIEVSKSHSRLGRRKYRGKWKGFLKALVGWSTGGCIRCRDLLLRWSYRASSEEDNPSISVELSFAASSRVRQQVYHFIRVMSRVAAANN